MTDSELERQSTAAAQIVDDAMAAAIDEAIEANVSSECFAAAILHHICSVLHEWFQQSPDDVALLAQKATVRYLAAASTHH